MTSCPSFFKSLNTLTSSSAWRMFNRPVGYANVEVPTFTTMRMIPLTLSHFLCFVVSSQHGIHHRTAQPMFFQYPHALNGAAAGAAHSIL